MKLLTRYTRLFIASVGLALICWTSAYGGEKISESISATSSAYRTPVIELYTSEGCSSCPTADNWLRQLGQSLDENFRAVPLAFHVDYWNYLGWADPYSKPEFTARQREVATNNGQSSIYTPEFLIDGREARGGLGIVQAIHNANSQKAAATITVSASRHGANGIQTRIRVQNDAPQARAYVAIYESDITREIGGGENHGKTLKHDFVVRRWSAPITIRQGDNHADLELEFPADCERRNLGVAVVVFNHQTGATVQAVSAPLASLFPG